jgi:hypothetical protein
MPTRQNPILLQRMRRGRHMQTPNNAIRVPRMRRWRLLRAQQMATQLLYMYPRVRVETRMVVH